MAEEIWYLALLLIAGGAALVVPTVRRWDRQAPSELPREPRRPVARSGTAAADAVRAGSRGEAATTATRGAATTTAPTRPGRPAKAVPSAKPAPGAKPGRGKAKAGERVAAPTQATEAMPEQPAALTRDSAAPS